MTTTSSGLQVETFEQEDASHSDATTMAADSEACSLIQSLGLKGQEQLVNGTTVTRVPYRAMEAREMQVYRALCDATAKVEDYSAEPIPLRVLQVVAHARETGLFNRIEVWYPKAARIDDPVLVGVRKTLTYPDQHQYSSLTTDHFHLLARWGKSLLPLEQMEAMALDLCRKTRLARLTEVAAQVRRALEDTKESLDLAYLTKTPYVSGIAD